MRRAGLLLLPLVAFIAFVLKNGAIVVGDHKNHVFSPHWAQLAYATAIVASMFGVLGGAYHENLIGITTWTFLRRYLLSRDLYVIGLSLTSMGLLVLVLRNFSVVHIFLLADNRHFTFYAWQRILSPIILGGTNGLALKEVRWQGFPCVPCSSLSFALSPAFHPFGSLTFACSTPVLDVTGESAVSVATLEVADTAVTAIAESSAPARSTAALEVMGSAAASVSALEVAG